MPVYNGLPYLSASIDSVLKQTFTDFELIIIDDGSSDESGSILDSIKDPRVRFFSQANRGLAATLNRGITLSKGQFIARQDQDDISFPQRLQSQLAFLTSHSNIGMVGTAAEIWVGNAPSGRVLRHSTSDPALKFNLLFDNYFVHSSILIRKSVLDSIGGYSEDRSRQPPEDYELWSRVMRRFQIANLHDVLIAYREVSTSMSRIGKNPFKPNLIKISNENLSWAVGPSISSSEILALSCLMNDNYDQMPRRTSFFALRKIIQIAAQNIENLSNSPGALIKLKRSRVRKLMYRYVDYRMRGLPSKILSTPLGSAIRKLTNLGR